jgi:FtsK/SpoIIIE family
VAVVADFHRVKTPTPLEFPPPTTRPAAQPTTWDWLILYVARPLWGFRVELAAALVVLLAWRWLATLLGRGPAALLLAAVVGGLLAVPAAGRRVLEAETRARVRRRWATACRYAGLTTASDRIPRIVKHVLIPAGDRLLVRLPAGASTAALAEAAEQVAVILDVREVRVARDPDHAALARVTVVRRDPLHNRELLAWPLLGAPRCSLWRPIPVGVDEDGQWVHVALPERNVLLGGEPGSGKSAAMALLLAAAALDPEVRLILLDGKLVELACWAGVADRSIGPDLHEAVEVLCEVQAELDRRLLALLANRRRKLTPTLGMPLLLVVIDELAFYVNAPDRKLAAEFVGRLRDLVARGRAAGIIVLAATQKPAAEVIPTSLRDLFGFRWALRCLTPQASDTVLGQGWASLGYSASTVDAADRGVGLLLAEGGTPARLRACWLDDDQLAALAARGEALRGLALPPPAGGRPGPAGSGQPGG